MRNLVAVALAALAGSAQAATWSIGYDQLPDHWAGPASFAIQFTADDRNKDGVFDATELSDLSIWTFGRQYQVFPIVETTTGRGTITSFVDWFRFDTRQKMLDAEFSGINGEDSMMYMPGGFSQSAAFWSTEGAIPTVIPEPATYALFLAGLTLLRFGRYTGAGRYTRGSSKTH